MQVGWIVGLPFCQSPLRQEGTHEGDSHSATTTTDGKSFKYVKETGTEEMWTAP